jgi:hypothetical protein
MNLALSDVRDRRIARHFEGEILAVMAQAKFAIDQQFSALQLIIESIEKSRSIQLSLVKALIALSNVALALGRLDQCREALEQLARLTRAIGAVNYEPLVFWLQAKLAAACQNPDESRDLLRRARQGFMERGAVIHARTISGMLD